MRAREGAGGREAVKRGGGELNPTSAENRRRQNIALWRWRNEKGARRKTKNDREAAAAAKEPTVKRNEKLGVYTERLKGARY